MEEDSMVNYVDIVEAAKRTGLSVTTWERRCERGAVDGAVKVGEVWRVRLPRVEVESE